MNLLKYINNIGNGIYAKKANKQLVYLDKQHKKEVIIKLIKIKT
jgi:hypothetical protein